MKFQILLALIVTVGHCQDGIEKIKLFVEEQSAIRNISMDVVHTFSLDLNSVVMWREVVNNMTLSKKDKKYAQTFLDYVRYTFKLADEIIQENGFSYGKRFQNFKNFYGSPNNSLTEKQLCDANGEIEDAINETAKKRRHIERYISDVNEKIEDIKTKILELKRRLTATVIDSKAETRKNKNIQEKSFESLEEASRDAMDAIKGKRITKSLIIPMFEEIKEAVKIENKLVKILNKICLTIE